ncbi:hypothetical protein [Streptomyces apocyni]|uniref:hypothetical protein n=1 Tax=Streptomyces apocyni TaxID=2654677 RepID=UPI0012E9F07D|nr:hypothetical protein [Streptomyces apocyni]
MRTTRTSRPLRRFGPAVAVGVGAVAVGVPLALFAVLGSGFGSDSGSGSGARPAGGAGDGAGVSVTADGSVVRVSTGSCPDGGRAALLSPGRGSFAQGRQAELTGSGGTLRASWPDVAPGTYTVAVVCSGGQSAGAQRVTVTGTPSPTRTPPPTPTASPTSPTSVPTTAPTTDPSGKVRAGFGGGPVTEPGPDPQKQIAGGAALAVTAGIGGAWLIRRRNRRTRRAIYPH